MESTVRLPFDTSHAFIIGINEYENVSTLTTAVNDATVLARKLEEEHGYDVHPPLLDATKEDILKLLTEDIPTKVKEKDRVLFYFAGHGIALDSDSDPNGYLVPADANPGEIDSLIPMDLLHDVVVDLPCQHGLIIMDCCFAGAFKWSTGYRDVIFDLPGVLYEQRFYQYAKDPAWQVITSSASDQKAVDILTDRILGFRNEEGEEHSPFALALFAGLDGEGDTIPKERGDGVITATELYTFLRDTVEDATMDSARRQSPSMFALNKHNKGQYIFLSPNHRLNLPPIPDRNPFMGLKSYDEADVNLFYGRTRVIEALEEMIREKPLVVVSGASGTGKSSVIKAGLIPKLREEEWNILPIIRPGQEPMELLEREIPDMYEEIKGGQNTLLVIDQYEELITQSLQEEDWDNFENQLLEWIHTYPNLRIIISIRSDFEPQFEHAGLQEYWIPGRYMVPGFSQYELREVIIKPTIQEVLFFEPDELVDKLVDEVNQAPGALPLLSFTLSELYYSYVNSGRTNRALTMEDYDKLGGVIGALRTKANTIYEGLNRKLQKSMKQLMLRMVSLEGGEVASRRVWTEDLDFSNKAESKRMKKVAGMLVDARLIATGRDVNGRTYYEPAHDALVRAWNKLWEWMKEYGEDKLSLMYKLSMAIADYEEAEGTTKQKRKYLWNKDPRLGLLEAELLNGKNTFNKQEEEFLFNSLRARKRNSRRRVMSWAASIAIFLLAAFAFFEKSEADKAIKVAEQAKIEVKSDLFAVDALHRLSHDATTSLNLAFAAYKTHESDASRHALDDILSQNEYGFYRRTLAGNTGYVKAVAFSPDDKYLATSASDDTIKIWNAATGKLIDKWRGHGKKINALDFSPDGTQLLSASKDNTVQLWNIMIVVEGRNESLSFNKSLTFKGHTKEVLSVVFSPDGQTIASASSDNYVKLWDIATAYELKTFKGHTKTVWSVAFSPDGEKLLSGSSDNTLKLWNVENGTEIRTYEGHTKAVKSVVFSIDGKNLLSGSNDYSARLWDAGSGQQIRSFDGHHGRVFSVAFSPDGNKIVTGSGDNTLRLWDVRNGKVISSYAGHNDDVFCVLFSSDGEILVSGSQDKTTKLWNVTRKTGVTPHYGHEGFVRAVAYSLDGKYVLSGGDDQSIILWEAATEKLIRDWPRAHEGNINALAFSPDGEHFVSASNDKTLKLWDIAGESRPKTFTGHKKNVNSVAFSPTGDSLISGSSDKTLILWDEYSTEMMATFEGHTSKVRSVAFSPDGKKIISGSSDASLKVWDVETHEMLKTLTADDRGINSVAFSPDGNTVIAGSEDHEIHAWDLRIDGEPRSFYGHWDVIRAVCFSPNGKYILSSSDDNNIKLWDFESGVEFKSFSGHSKSVSALAFSPDGKKIVSGSEDLTVRVWKVASKLEFPVASAQKFGEAERRNHEIEVEY